MHIKLLNLFGILFFTTNIFGQDQSESINKDPYAILTRDLIHDICSEKPIEALLVHFCDSLQGDQLFYKLNHIRSIMTKGNKDCNIYMRRIVRGQLFFYNVHLYNEATKEQYGDVKIVFSNTDDMKIDELLYLDHVERDPNKKITTYLNIPPPPPPPKEK